MMMIMVTITPVMTMVISKRQQFFLGNDGGRHYRLVIHTLDEWSCGHDKYDTLTMATTLVG